MFSCSRLDWFWEPIERPSGNSEKDAAAPHLRDDHPIPAQKSRVKALKLKNIENLPSMMGLCVSTTTLYSMTEPKLTPGIEKTSSL